MKRRFALSSVLLLLAGAASADSPFRVGSPLPSLRLPALDDGRPLSLSDFRGEKVMLHVWASW